MINTRIKRALAMAIIILPAVPFFSHAQQNTDSAAIKPPKKWYETFQIRGYTQIRYNNLLETNSDLKNESADKSWGGNGGFFIRRLRLVFSGKLNDRVSFYIQPDFASAVSTTLNYGNLRDAYFDVNLDNKGEFRFRFGQSKAPYSFEVLQSSQNRAPLDRSDPINSAFPNERDLGVFFYWAPAKIRERFKYLVESGLKGTGDYGVFGTGVFNGQGMNKPEENKTLHTIARITYPFQIGNQFFEPSVQAYTGKFVVASITKDVTGINNDFEYLDRRLAVSATLYPQPIGIQGEYNWGKGPEYDPASNSILEKNLHGGYVMGMYRQKIFKNQYVVPFIRYMYYNGGKKNELDARKYRVRDIEFGSEWLPVKFMEAQVTYVISNRTFEDAVLPNNVQKGNLLRLQLQFNY